MKIFYIGIYKYMCNWKEILKSYNLKDLYFFQRDTAKQVFVFISDTLIRRTYDGDPYQILYEHTANKYYCHLYRDHGLAVTLLTDRDYPHLVAKRLISKLFSYKKLTEKELCDLHQQYGKPYEVDKVYKTQATIERTRTVMVDNINLIMNRGENLESLAEKTDLINDTAKKFLTKSKQMNKCCYIL